MIRAPRLADFRRKPAASWAPAPRATRPKNAHPRQLSAIGVRTAPRGAVVKSSKVGRDALCHAVSAGDPCFGGSTSRRGLAGTASVTTAE